MEEKTGMAAGLGRRLVLMGGVLLGVMAACAAPGGAATTVAPETMEVEPTTELTTEPETEAAATAATGGRTIEAGAEIAVFGPYSITVPEGWADERQVAEGVVDTLLLTNSGYTLQISQAPGGGGQCHFDGVVGVEGQSFPEGFPITGTASEFMRGTSDGGANWVVCEMGPDTFGFPTNYGYITYVTPSPADEAMLAAMDAMVASLAAR
jgi:hypothetical protein